MPYPVLAVANSLLDLADRDGQSMNHQRLQKLLVVAHGWHLACRGEPLLDEPVHAGPYGPLLRGLYEKLKHNGSDPLQGRVAWQLPTGKWTANSAAFEGPTAKIVERVWEQYRHMNGLQLSTLTHEKGTPWALVTGQPEGAYDGNLVIPDKLFRDYYHALAMSN